MCPHNRNFWCWARKKCTPNYLKCTYSFSSTIILLFFCFNIDIFYLGCSAWRFGLRCCFLFQVSCLKLTFHSDFMLTSSRMGRDIHLYRYLTHWIISSLTWNKNYWLAHQASGGIKRNRQSNVSGIFLQKHLKVSDVFHI